MGRIERMLLHFCIADGWDRLDSLTRGRCVARLLKTDCKDVVNHAIVDIGVWRRFYMRHPEAMRKARVWNRTVARLVAGFDSEDALSEIDRMLESVKT